MIWTPFKDRPLKDKLALVTILTTSGVLAFAVLMICLAEATVNWFNVVNQTKVTALTIAHLSESALVFGDEITAKSVLEALSHQENIVQATLFLDNDSILARYINSTAKDLLPLKPGKIDAHSFDGGYLLFNHRIIFNEEFIGTLAIRLDLSEFFTKLLWFLLAAWIVWLVSILFAFFLWRKLQTIVTDPVLSLARLVKKVSEDNDYSIRGQVNGKDELGSLVNGINEMLEGIQERDERLANHQKYLEKEVVSRTRDLVEVNRALKTEVLERRSMQLDLERFKTTLDKTFDGVFMFVPGSWEIFYSNQGAIVQTQMSEDEILGTSFEFLLAEYNQVSFQSIIDQVMQHSQHSHTFETLFCKKDKASFSAEIFLQYVEPLDSTGRFLAIIRDTTTQKEFERELEEAKNLAESANKLKSLFLANMSHEIRTPMNAVIGMTQLVLHTELSSQQKDYMDKILLSANGLLKLINDILDLSKIEAKKMTLEEVEFDLKDCLDEVIQILSIMVYKKGLQFIVEIPPWIPNIVIGDPLRLHQIIYNLLGNSIKFTSEGHVFFKIDTECSSTSSSNQIKLRFTIQDTGVGIQESLIESLFVYFSQADVSYTRKYGGTGLGLSICNNLVNLMGGEISVTSELGKGSSFSFILPMNLPSPSENRPSQTVAKKFKGKQVLVIDPYPPGRDAMIQMLEWAGIQGIGSDGVNFFSENEGSFQFDAILLDNSTENQDLSALADNLGLLDHGFQHIPVLLLDHPYGSPRHTSACSIVGTLGKPVRYDALLSDLDAMFNQKPLTRVSAYVAVGRSANHPFVGYSILVVDDISMNQQIAKEFLENSGYQITLADNGREAVEKSSKQAFDLILMDIQMPEMDGIEASRIIRSQSRFSNTPIIAMTAGAMDQDKKECLDAGMDDFLSKPIDPETMGNTILYWLSKNNPIVAEDQQSVQQKLVLEMAENSSSIPAELPGIDVFTGLRRVLNNEALFQELLGDFLQEFSDFEGKINQSIEANDLDKAWREIHGIKGVVGNLSMNRLYLACQGLEKKLRVDKTADDSLLEEFSNSLCEVIQGLENWLVVD